METLEHVHAHLGSGDVYCDLWRWNLDCLLKTFWEDNSQSCGSIKAEEVNV